jgi:DNA mismatch repair protein MutL
MSDIIRVLPDHVANQIAAGEVVQRPASVVKELLENAIDAGAEFIRLNIKESGRQMVEVIDDGKGMSSTDAILAFERHATSKISSAQDLFQLNTKGFRGEALASIAAVAQVELQTRQEEKDLGVKLKIEGSKITAEPEETLSEKGSRITVKNLFFNIPARRNFLKSNSVELKHITEEFTRVALAHPNLAFEYTHNGQTLYKLQASNLKKRIVQLFGSKFDEKLIPIHEDTEVVQLRGFLGKPEACKKRRGEQYFFVNGRFIKSSYLNHAVNAAYEGLIAKEQFPSFFIFLNIPAEEYRCQHTSY